MNISLCEKHMTAEDKITEYLTEYEVAREADIITYCKNDYSERAVKTAIQKMEKQGKIERIVHDRLKPVGVYFRLKHEAEKPKPSIFEDIFRELSIITELNLSNPIRAHQKLRHLKLMLPPDLKSQVDLDFALAQVKLKRSYSIVDEYNRTYDVNMRLIDKISTLLQEQTKNFNE